MYPDSATEISEDHTMLLPSLSLKNTQYIVKTDQLKNFEHDCL